MLVRYGASSKYGADIPLTVLGIVMKVFQIIISITIGMAAGCPSWDIITARSCCAAAGASYGG